jgi:hypothetical protein
MEFVDVNKLVYRRKLVSEMVLRCLKTYATHVPAWIYSPSSASTGSLPMDSTNFGSKMLEKNMSVYNM